MTSPLGTVRNVASYIPAKLRGAIYSILGLAIAAEAIWDVVPEVLEGKVLKTLTVAGFGLALTNTGSDA